MITNVTNIHPLMAAWLASNDGYDRKFDPTVVSATELNKPIKSLVLSRRMEGEPLLDAVRLYRARLGHAIHAGVEDVWRDPSKRLQALRALGWSENRIDRLKVNPTRLSAGDIPLYLEQRAERQLGKWTISGKFDAVVDGAVTDIKSTLVNGMTSGKSEHSYILQGSIYRWLNPELIVEDHVDILYVLLDWRPNLVARVEGYPASPIMTKRLELKTLEQTEAYIKDRLARLEAGLDVAQEYLEPCNSTELWQDPPTWAYYKNGNPASPKSTKNYDTPQEAYERLGRDGGTGIVVERKKEPTYCKFCPASSVCLQAEKYIEEGILVL